MFSHLDSVYTYVYIANFSVIIVGEMGMQNKVGSKVHPCTGTEALYRPYGP